MASPASVPSASALLQKASQQYIECRRKVTAKFDEVKLLESEIQSLFAHITRLGETNARATKSVGRLELQLTSVEGDAPVGNAVVRVEIDPEYEEPEPVTQEEKVEEAVKEAVSEQEPAEEQEKKEDEEKEQETSEETEGEEKKTEGEEKKTEGEEKKTEEQEAETPAEEAAAEEEDKEEVAEETEAEAKEAPRRSVQWDDAEGFPLKVVFDPVQSREAVVTITIAPAAEDDEETEPVKEFRIPVASLFQTGAINRVYVLKKVEHVHVDKAALTEVADEDAPVKASDNEAEKAEDEEKKTEEEAEKAEEEAEKAEEEAEKDEEEAEKDEEEAKKADEPSEKAVEDAAEPVTEVPEAPHETLVAAVATIESEDKVVVLKEGKLHVQLHFTMSEIEKLSQTAIALSQQKQEAEAVLAVLEREALSLRTKYERLSASQRSVSAGGVVKPRSTLLGGRGLGGAGAVPRPEKSAYQKAKDSLSAVFTPQRTQVITSFAIFCGSVALFHFQGDNLLA